MADARRSFLALAAVLMVSACSSPSGSTTTQPEATKSSPPGASEGCGRTAPKDGRTTFGGRSYLLSVPKRYDPRTPAPVIVDLHGLRSNALEQSFYGRIGSAGPPRGFIVAAPESAPGRTGWKLPGMADGSADVAYVGRLLDHLERTLCVDRKREFAAGMSNGGGLSAALVCGLRGRLAAVAPVAGINLARPCAGARPTTIVAFHGTSDLVIPYEGGVPFQGDLAKIPGWMRPSNGDFALPTVESVTARWAHTFRCRPAAYDQRGEIAHRRHTGCRGGVTVDLYTVRDGGHTWPGAFPIGVGKTTGQIDATDLILDAFTRR